MPRTSSSRSAVELLAVAVALVGPAGVAAQDTASVGLYSRAVATWISLIATPGSERGATERIVDAVPGWTRDDMGNLIKRVGDGTPRRVVACGIDETGYAVSAITEDGYLRVQLNGNTRRVALWDQFREGQRVVVEALDRVNPLRTRHIPGVFAVRSKQLGRGSVVDGAPTSIESLWVDIGAHTRADVERMGVDLLNPVVRDWPEWLFSDYVAGPSAGNRAACAAVAAVAASSNRASAGETVFIVSAQKSFNWSGLAAALTRLGRVDAVYVADVELGNGQGVREVRAPWPATNGLDIGTVYAIGVATRFTGTLAESIREPDIEELHRDVARAAGLGGRPAPIQLAHGWTAAPPLVTRDSLSRFADMIGKLTDIYAVSGTEQPIRDGIQQALPGWARDSAVVDSAGNLVLAMGPDRDTAVFVAHMDEIGFFVSLIARDGTVSLRTRGTFFPFLWEGQTALLHRPDDKIPRRDGRLGCSASREGPLRGVFVPRDRAGQREPAAITAWFGLDSAHLVASGVRVGLPLTSYKCSARVGDVRLTARSLDDRAGVTAMVVALDEIEPAKLDHKVIFAWSVREQRGHEGAKALAVDLGPSVHRVYAIDPFASSDSPLENRQLSYAPIGAGPVIRSLDAGATPPEEIDRVVKLARTLGIPVQAGVADGGNDGSEGVRFGAVHVALAWPLRYSHSPAEVIDLRDLRSLTRMVAALAKAPTMPPGRPSRP